MPNGLPERGPADNLPAAKGDFRHPIELTTGTCGHRPMQRRMRTHFTREPVMTGYDVLRYAHISAGTLALACFWTAASLRKGSEGHRIVGRTFLIAIVGVCLTGIGIAIAAFERQQPVRGTFFAYLVLLTATPSWVAWRAIRDKRDVKRFAGPLYHVLGWANVVAGVTVLALGIRFQQLVLGVASVLGLIAGSAMLRFARDLPTGRTWWLARHYGSMVAVGIATHVAFLNLGLSHVVPAEWGTTVVRLSWFAPITLALLARVWLDRKYGVPRTVAATA
jgi:hypothetical protein